MDGVWSVGWESRKGVVFGGGGWGDGGELCGQGEDMGGAEGE